MYCRADGKTSEVRLGLILWKVRFPTTIEGKEHEAAVQFQKYSVVLHIVY